MIMIKIVIIYIYIKKNNNLKKEHSMSWLHHYSSVVQFTGSGRGLTSCPPFCPHDEHLDQEVVVAIEL